QIYQKPPFPAYDGGALGIHIYTEGLIAEGIHVSVLAFDTPRTPVDFTALSNDYIQKTNFKSVKLNTSIKLIPAFLNLFSNKSYNIDRYYSKHVENEIKDYLLKNKFDLIQLEGLY